MEPLNFLIRIAANIFTNTDYWFIIRLPSIPTNWEYPKEGGRENTYQTGFYGPTPSLSFFNHRSKINDYGFFFKNCVNLVMGNIIF